MVLRKIQIAFIFVAFLANSSCATIFSGQGQEVKFKSRPPGGTVLIVDGAPASLLKFGTKASQFLQRFGKLLSKKDRAFLKKYSFESILTALIIQARKEKNTKASKAKAVAVILKKIPPGLKNLILKKFGLNEYAVTPFKTKLERGESYVAIGYIKGKQIVIEPIEKNVNWVTLWNVLNLGVGFFVDLYTGTWRDQPEEPVLLKITKKQTKDFS